MPWGPAPTFQLIIPEDAGPNDPQIVIGPDIPQEIIDFYASEPAVVVGVILLKETEFDYNYIAYVNPTIGVSFMAFGALESVGFTVQEHVRFKPGGGLAPPARTVFTNPVNVNQDAISPANSTITDTVTAGTTTSATYATVPGNPSHDITKFYSDTDTNLLITFILPMKSTAVATDARIGIRINGVDTEIIRYTFEVANVTQTLAGLLRVDALPADFYTCELVWRRNGGAGTLTTTAAFTYSLRVEEVAV